MIGKRNLSRIMSALLAASSMIGGASAGKKKVGKRPNSAGVVLRDRENRGRDKGGNERSNKRGEKLGLSSAESRVVSWIKKHPKTSAGLGLAGLSAIGYGVYKIYNNNSGSYKIDDNNSDKIDDNNSEWDSIYRKMFSEQNCEDFLDFSWCNFWYDSEQKMFNFFKSVEVDEMKKVLAGFSVGTKFIDSLSVKNESKYEKIFKHFLRLWILIYSCERMVKAHPEWSYLLKNGDKFGVMKSGDSGLRLFASGSIKKLPENSEKLRDLREIYEWARVFDRFEDEYLEQLLEYVKGYAKQNNISIVRKIDDLVSRARGAHNPHDAWLRCFY